MKEENKEGGIEGKKKEKRKLQAETDRAQAAAEMKRSHAEIEEIEKERKWSSVKSIVARIDSLLGLTGQYLAKVSEEKTREAIIQLLSSTAELYSAYAREYVSIRTDLVDVLELGEKRAATLFPQVAVTISDAIQIPAKLGSVVIQLDQMRSYLQRAEPDSEKPSGA